MQRHIRRVPDWPGTYHFRHQRGLPTSGEMRLARRSLGEGGPQSARFFDRTFLPIESFALLPMYRSNHDMTHHPSSFTRVAGVVTITGLLSLYAGGVSAQRQEVSLPKADTWSAMHVLNRIGYGARPGDLERVQKMGLAAYIEEQLHPERIDNSALNTR